MISVILKSQGFEVSVRTRKPEEVRRNGSAEEKNLLSMGVETYRIIAKKPEEPSALSGRTKLDLLMDELEFYNH